MGYPRTEVEKKWQKLSRWLRSIYTSCIKCGISYKDTSEGFLHGHHLGNRNHRGNEPYILCPYNIAIICQKCHVEIEPSSHVLLYLARVDKNGNEIEPATCCGKGIYCSRFKKDRNIPDSKMPNYQYKQDQARKKAKCLTHNKT